MPGRQASFTLPDVKRMILCVGASALCLVVAGCASSPATLAAIPTSQAIGITEPSATGFVPSASPVGPACPVATGTAVTLAPLGGGASPADAVSAYLQAGGDPEPLAADLFERGWVSPTSAVVWTDVDGDGRLDLAAGLTAAPDPQGIASDGAVFVWRCQDGSYRRLEAAPRRPDHGLPALREARDLTGDGVPDLLVAHPLCGAHTCYEQYSVLAWREGALVERFQGASDDMPYPKLAIESDGPGAPAVITVTATGIGSVGAGPYRMWTRSWTWDAASQTFQPGEAVFEAPRYRIHLLYDADDAYNRGDIAAALDLYNRVIEDDTLLDWPGPGERRAQLSAYAAYRRVLAMLVSGDVEQAQAESATRLTGTDPTTAAFAELARRLIAGASQDALAGACAQVPAFAGDHADDLLAFLDFGYANRSYSAHDLCSLPHD